MLSEKNNSKGNIRRLGRILVPFVFLFFVLLGMGLLWGSKRDTRITATNPATPTAPTTQRDDFSFTEFKETRDLWSEKIEILGAQKAYSEFIARAMETPWKAHQLMHIIGALLYEKEGLDGIALCDETELYGCYHGFIAQAVETQGLEAFGTVAEKCSRENTWERNAACIHGIGHGLLGLVGRKNITMALDLCESIHKKYGLSKKDITGCFSGLFMEYHFTHEKSTGAPMVIPEALQEPCDTIPEDFLPQCYFEQPHWWRSGLKKDIRSIGDLCMQLPKEAERDACFLGLGLVFTLEPEATSREKVRDMCKNMSTQDIQNHCLVGAAWFYFFRPDRQEWAHGLCTDLPDELQKKCLQQAF